MNRDFGALVGTSAVILGLEEDKMVSSENNVA